MNIYDDYLPRDKYDFERVDKLTLWNAICAILDIKVRFSRKNAFFLCFNIANCSFIYSSQKKPVGENGDEIKECIMKTEDKKQM